jgi:hypothetical protein
VTGYRIHAVDGDMGHIENLMIDDADWSAHYFIVNTRNWWFGQARAYFSPLDGLAPPCELSFRRPLAMAPTSSSARNPLGDVVLCSIVSIPLLR